MTNDSEVVIEVAPKVGDDDRFTIPSGMVESPENRNLLAEMLFILFDGKEIAI